MPLPVLSLASEPSAADLLRRFHRTERLWAEQLSEPSQLECGVAFCTAALSAVRIANCVLEAALPIAGAAAADSVAEVEAHFSAAGGRCRQWILNVSASAEKTAPLAEHLLSTGYQASSADVMLLAASPPPTADREPTGLTLLPARAAFRQARALAEEAAAAAREPQRADEIMLHLDDPHCDSILALSGGRAIGQITVLSAGEMGRIDLHYVAAAHRRQGIGRLLLRRAIEICARSLFKQVMLRVTPENESAAALYRSFGFRKIGEMGWYWK